MNFGKLLTITLNAFAFLVLGMAGAASANVLKVDDLTVYGPEFFSGVQTILVFALSAISGFSAFTSLSGLSGFSAGLVTIHTTDIPGFQYAVAPFVSDILSLAQTAYSDIANGNALQSLFSSLFSSPSFSAISTSIYQQQIVVLLPPSDPIFATTPLPSAASLMISGIAALAFVGRIAKRRLQRTPA